MRYAIVRFSPSFSMRVFEREISATNINSSMSQKSIKHGENDAGYIAWQLWGGDAGRTWANRVIKMVENRQSKQ